MTNLDRLGTPVNLGPFRQNVFACASSNVTLYGEQTIDGVVCGRGKRVLLTAQTNAAENGPWVVQAGAWIRPKDFQREEDALQAMFVVQYGTSDGLYRVSTPAPISVGTTSLTLVPVSFSEVPPDGTVTAEKLSPTAVVDSLGYTPANLSVTVPNITSPAVITVPNAIRQRPDLRMWSGLDLTGANASTTTFQRAIDDMEGTGELLHIPPGTITLDATIDLRGQCSFQGPDWAGMYDAGKSAWFKIAHTGRGFYADATTGSYNISRIGTFRNQPSPGAGWTPTGATDFDFWLSAQDVHIDQVTLLNPTYGIRLEAVTNGGGVGRLRVSNALMQPFKEGITILSAYDTCRLDSTHIWPIWSQDNNVRDYMLANLDSYRSFVNDNSMWDKIFSIWHKVGLYLGNYAGNGPSYPGGSTKKLRIMGGDLDKGTQGIVVAGDGVTADMFGLSIQGRDDATVSTSALVSTTGNNSSISFHGCSLHRAGGSLVRLDGTGNRLAFSGVRTGEFNLTSGAWPAFEAASGNTIYINDYVWMDQVLTYGGAGEIFRTEELTNYTPAITANGGAFASGGSAPTITVARYRVQAGIVYVMAEVAFGSSTLNTATGAVRIALPYTSKRAGGGCGRVVAGTGSNAGKQLAVTVAAASSHAEVVIGSDNTMPVQSGQSATIRVTLEYEV